MANATRPVSSQFGRLSTYAIRRPKPTARMSRNLVITRIPGNLVGRQFHHDQHRPADVLLRARKPIREGGIWCALDDVTNLESGPQRRHDEIADLVTHASRSNLLTRVGITELRLLIE